MEETWRLIDAGEKIELKPEPQRRKRKATAAKVERDQHDM